MRYAIFCAREDRSLLEICVNHIAEADPLAVIDILPREKSDKPLMVAKCEAWLQHLLEHDSSVVFLDDDIIVQKPLDPPCDADVILTARDIPGLHPYNTGVVWANGRGALPFFHEVLGHVQSLPEDRQAWYGDQDAVSAIAETHAHAEVSCEVWNWTPEHFGKLREDGPSKAVIHFKGPRKGWMRWYDKQVAA